MAKESSSNSTETTDPSDLKTIRVSTQAQGIRAVRDVLATEMPAFLTYLTGKDIEVTPNTPMTEIKINSQVSMSALEQMFGELA